MLRERLLATVADSGPIPFEQFMEAALYDPEDGFFTGGGLRSDREGDFLTSPEVSRLFGETIGRFVAAERERIGEPFMVMEVGAGSGSLLQPLLDSLESVPETIAVDVSPAARQRIAERLPRVRVEAAEPGEAVRGVIIANELLDNLPAAVAIRRSGGWAERWVGIEGDALTPVEVSARPEVAAWADRHAGPCAEGSVVEVQIAAGDWLAERLESLVAGAVLVFDYGDIAEGLANRRGEGTLRTYKSHHLGPDPLLDPGATDITMDVDFGALATVAKDAGADSAIHRQDEFLERWGLRERLTALRHAELEEARRGDPMRRLRLRSEITGAETLLHPRGLGDFRVLVARR